MPQTTLTSIKLWWEELPDWERLPLARRGTPVDTHISLVEKLLNKIRNTGRQLVDQAMIWYTARVVEQYLFCLLAKRYSGR